jgi:Protein of unknown function (DUF3667)
MTSGEDIVGDIVQGGLIARAAEPAHGETGDGHTDDKVCLNCGAALLGKHCHACGQVAHVHRTLGAFFHDLLHGVLHFEGKIWRTLPLLAWNPGKLTREYIDGRRANYVSPIALFLFCVFATFAVFNLGAGGDLTLKQAKAAISAPENERRAQAEVARLEAELAESRRRGQVPSGLEEQLEGAREGLSALRAIRGGNLPDSIAISEDSAEKPTADRINAAWRHFTENPELTAFKLQSVAYKYSWLLIPLSVPFLWLLFPFSRRFHLYDHTVFATYSLSFMLLLLALVTLANMSAALEWLVMPALLYVPWHLYRQLRGAYDLSSGGALLRLPLLLLFAILVVVLWGVALLALVITG